MRGRLGTDMLWSVPRPDDSRDFEAWLRSVTFNPAAPVDDPGEVSEANRRWLRRFFDGRGPAPKDVVDAAFLTDQLALANEAVAAVLEDLGRTSSLRPEVVVDVWMGNGIRILIDSGYTAPSMWAVERAEAFAEVAEYFQEQLDLADFYHDPLDPTPGSWPKCADHDVGLDAAVHEAVAVWWCRFGGHVVAAIGELGS